MADYLVIVESPAKAKTIGKFLGKNYKIEASVGHIRDLPKSQIGVDIENDFEPKYITIRGKGDLIAKLRKAAKSAKKVYLATDPDREGEAISWHLAQILKVDVNKDCRITFNEITKNAVKNAISNSRPIDMKVVDAQQARRVLDRIVGYKISPLLWKKVRKGLSAGRVQSVTTKLICDREAEIDAFQAVEYWSLDAKLKKTTGGTVEAKFYGTENEKIELKSEKDVENILAKIGKKSFSVKKVKIGEKKRQPAPPFITSSLQQEAAKKLGYTTKKTMIIAQQLYEGVDVKGEGSLGLVTYIRTDSLRVSEESQQEARELIVEKYGEKYVPESPRLFKNKSQAQDAHEAIRPSYVKLTPADLKESLSNDQYKLYKLIWERFMASQMASAIYDTVGVDFSVTEYIFKASGSKVRFQGFMTIYTESTEDSDENENKEQNIPELTEGDKLSCTKHVPKQHFTQPPPRYTEASLVKELEERGIGRPSTYAPTITTIQSRGYVEKEQKQLLPTELGKIVNDIMKNYFTEIVDVDFTAQMEQKLDDVEGGNKFWKEIIKQFYSGFEGVLKIAEEEIGQIEIPEEVSDVICEKCGRNLVVKMSRFGKFLACPGFPECRNTKPILEEAGVNCPECDGKVIIKKTKRGRKYLGCENNPGCKFMTWDKIAKELCPKCGAFMLTKTTGKKKETKCSKEQCGHVNDN